MGLFDPQDRAAGAMPQPAAPPAREPARYDPELSALVRAMTQAGMPAQGVAPSAIGAEQWGQEPASLWQRLGQIAQWSGNALPFRGALKHEIVPPIFGDEGPYHLFKWAPTEEGLDLFSGKYQPELSGGGAVDLKHPNVLRDLILNSEEVRGGATGREHLEGTLVPIGFDKLRAAWSELRPALEKLGIDTLQFEPASGLFAGKNASREARMRLFEWLTGSKATRAPSDFPDIPGSVSGQWRVPVNPAAKE
jgi:hypothetical protein